MTEPVDIDDELLQTEVFSIERLEQFASELVNEHLLGKETRRVAPLFSRLEINERVLTEAYRQIAEDVRKGRLIAPAAEWLMDNFHIVQEQLREIREDLPLKYLSELPKLSGGPYQGYPRVYAIAVSMIERSDYRVDAEILRRFIQSYQQTTPLGIGELWAVAIMLRLALLENLRRLARHSMRAQAERERADRWADELLATAEKQPGQIFVMLAERERSVEDLSSPFAAQLMQRLRDQGASIAPALLWLEQRFTAQETSGDEMIRLEHQSQASTQVSVGNVITSMRLLSSINWAEFVESTSLMEQALREDPAGTHTLQDFETRNRYRTVVEKIARQSRRTEIEIASRAVEYAREAKTKDPTDEARSHVGYYLIGPGRARLEREVKYWPDASEILHQAATIYPTFVYLGAIGLITGLAMWFLLGYAHSHGAGPVELGLIALLLLIPASDFAVSATNRDLTFLLNPHVLPKLEFQRGIPPEYSTIVVVPTMLVTEENVRELLDRLEIHYLANQEENLHFALLTDYTDAPSVRTPGDDALLTQAIYGVRELNERYDDEGSGVFHLFHRRRQWNESEGVWMGWERKRGKLEEFNRLLRGATDTSYDVQIGDNAFLPGVRYVISLDADTRLPRDAAKKLVATIAHPLNRARYDEKAGRVTSGYGILQPRVSITLESAGRSLFTRIFSGNTGIDPYTSAVSDIYQDLFAEGNYVGKGIYDVDAFEAALGGKLPLNRILSHDLIEGIYARTALVTDVELFDDYPSHYHAYASRQHRWVRGDWQIAGWLTAALPLISKWKIFDNLRRSVVAPAMLLLLAAAWTVLPGSPILWTLLAMLALAFPIYSHIGNALILHPRGVAWTSHFLQIWDDALRNTYQVALTIAFLPHQSWLMLDAVSRTLMRLMVTKKRLLEWVTAAQTERKLTRNLDSFHARMRPAVIVALVLTAIVAFGAPHRLLVALPFLAVWLVSPVIAFWISQRAPQRKITLSARERTELRAMARLTWRFFETFVTKEDSDLPPDNYQEDPKGVLARRTSPTNIGVYLLSTQAAYDFGYLDAAGLITKLERTFESLMRMERYRGHLYNWYDTESLNPLSPKYISTVDSGNLAGHLLAVKQACHDVLDQLPVSQRSLDGLDDPLILIQQTLGRIKPARRRGAEKHSKALEEQVTTLRKALRETPETPQAWAGLLDELCNNATTLEQIGQEFAAQISLEGAADVAYWAGAFGRSARGHRDFLKTIAPWAWTLHERGAHAPTARGLGHFPSLADTVEWADQLLTELGSDGQEKEALKETIRRSAATAGELVDRYRRISDQAEQLSAEMDFTFLFDDHRRLFSIGFNVVESRRDNSYYDLLASEARLASYVSISRDQAPQQHWFKLGRQLTTTNSGLALLSWTATMFEYLMPLLVMRSYENTLLDQTYQAVVGRQIEYAAQFGIPWGISESAYNARNLQLHYQYQAFGVPGLGLKRGLSDDLVVAPYATFLALMIKPHEAVRNLKRLEEEGGKGAYGFYDAIDYTPARAPRAARRGEKDTMELEEEKQQKKTKTGGAVVRNYMAHHHGMSLLALDNVLNGNIMQYRFHREPLVRATELLLQERIPRNAPLAHPHAEEVSSARAIRMITPPVTRQFTTPHTTAPQAHLMSNGNYTVMVTNAGGGFSRWRGLAVTRWREDTTRDHCGSFCYVRDARTGAYWSTSYQPTTRQPQTYLATFSADKAEFHRLDDEIETHTEIGVSPEDDAEVRRVTVTNRGASIREIEVTSFAEMVLAPPAADAAHPAFSNLFVQTEYIPSRTALLFTRRPRSSEEKPPWAVHVIAARGPELGALEYETDRSRFIGRGRTPAAPVSVAEGRVLSGTVGAVLDPAACLRQRVRLAPGEKVRLAFVTAIAETRDAAYALADKYHDLRATARALSLAWTHSQVELRHLNISAEEANLFLRLASHAIYTDGAQRPASEVLMRNTKQQSGLWAYGISGDLPVILVRIAETEEAEIVRQLLHAHEYWRLKGMPIDLVILNEHPSSYAQGLQEHLLSMIRTSPAQAMMDRPGGVFLRRADLMPEEDRNLLLTVAKVVLVGRRDSLAQQLSRRAPEVQLPPPLKQAEAEIRRPQAGLESRASELKFFNGLGGFTPDGREYVIEIQEGKPTPAPWVNVIANPRFGFLATESGAGYTWSENSRENRLTPWSNDPVSDPIGEAIYLRDEETGERWTTAPRPIVTPGLCVVRHGQGYTIYERRSHGLKQELSLFVPPEDPVKFFRLRVKNESGRVRRLSATSYFEWALGVLRESSSPYLVTEIDAQTGALIAVNRYNHEFANRTAFADVNDLRRTLTGDRAEFIGRNGTLASPAALRRTKLSGRVGAGFDPCAALAVQFELGPDQEREIIFSLGEADDLEQARSLIRRYRDARESNAAFDHVREYWDRILGAVEVRTPEPSVDLLLNRWLLYQTLVCRIMGRSAFYQSGGAYGFRDQLQDVMALVYSSPNLTREQILRAAARQFSEGDVQHWWHPPTGRGVRTRFSDDLQWLAFVTSFYITATGDTGVLDEKAPFLYGRPLEQHEDEYYALPSPADEEGAIYEHCVRALDRGLAVGAHGLPLMGSGDWNDGMNRVGNGGKGESVWMAWFLIATLNRFAPLAEERGDVARAKTYREHAEKLSLAVEKEAWDGAWYRRAYFDDGTPLGSSENEECRIDSIAQSWGVISGAADPSRAAQALASVDEYLVRKDEKLIMLFTPPFDQTPLDPGYIKGYVPGVRENGGQYTHGALWTVLAHALRGDGDRAGELFQLINPITHTLTPADAELYKVEPYVVAADVYGVAPHTGRGGWTWYTGSAGWMYQIGVEAILGLKLQGASFTVDPCIPKQWPGFEMVFRHRSAEYRITVENPHGVSKGVVSVEMDGERLEENAIPLEGIEGVHTVRVVMGEGRSSVTAGQIEKGTIPQKLS